MKHRRKLGIFEKIRMHKAELGIIIGGIALVASGCGGAGEAQGLTTNTSSPELTSDDSRARTELPVDVSDTSSEVSENDDAADQSEEIDLSTSEEQAEIRGGVATESGATAVPIEDEDVFVPVELNEKGEEVPVEQVEDNTSEESPDTSVVDIDEELEPVTGIDVLLEMRSGTYADLADNINEAYKQSRSVEEACRTWLSANNSENLRELMNKVPFKTYDELVAEGAIVTLDCGRDANGLIMGYGNEAAWSIDQDNIDRSAVTWEPGQDPGVFTPGMIEDISSEGHPLLPEGVQVTLGEILAAPEGLFCYVNFNGVWEAGKPDGELEAFLTENATGVYTGLVSIEKITLDLSKRNSSRVEFTVKFYTTNAEGTNQPLSRTVVMTFLSLAQSNTGGSEYNALIDIPETPEAVNTCVAADGRPDRVIHDSALAFFE